MSQREQLIVPSDFTHLSLQALKQLQATGRSNMLYSLAVGLGTKRKKMVVIQSFSLRKLWLVWWSDFFNVEVCQNTRFMGLAYM